MNANDITHSAKVAADLTHITGIFIIRFKTSLLNMNMGTGSIVLSDTNLLDENSFDVGS